MNQQILILIVLKQSTSNRKGIIHHQLKYSTQYTAHNTQYTVHNTQYTIHSTQYTIHSTQYTIHSTVSQGYSYQ